MQNEQASLTNSWAIPHICFLRGKVNFHFISFCFPKNPYATMSSTWTQSDLKSWNVVINSLIRDSQHDIPDPTGKTPLQHIANYGYPECMRKLCIAGVNIDRQDRCRRTALFRASAGGHTEVVEVLLEYSTDPDIQRENGLSLIYQAIINRYQEVATLLLSHNAKIPLTGLSSVQSAGRGS